ncbi:MAG TPA: MMPL family transporter [Gaiellaceae bacterium]|nr:MMPL family transporter [Gaiellaceae bacterium]
MNLAARAGRWSAAHWKTATVGWLLLVVAAVAAGTVYGSVQQSPAEQTNGGAAKAERMLAAAGFHTPAGETVLVSSKTATAGTPGFDRTVADVRSALASMPQVRAVHLGGISKDRHAELVQFSVAGSADTAADRIQPVLDRVQELAAAHPGTSIVEVGDASVERGFNSLVSKDLSRAEKLSLPLTFLILLLAFGAFVAAGIPVLLAFSAVLAAIGLTELSSHLLHEVSTTANVIVLMGMAVGVDYSLFYLKREREERVRGADPETALQRAAATSGRAVLVSGLTVMTAAAGMMLSGSKIFMSLGLGTILVVVVAMIGSLTVLPALLGKLGDRVEWGRIRRRPRPESRLWGIILRPALRYPRLTVAGTVALLVAIAVPAVHLHTRNAGIAEAPPNAPIVQAYTAVTQSFGAAAAPAVVVVHARDVEAAPVRAGVAALGRAVDASPVLHGPVHEVVNHDRTVARIDVPLAGDGDDAASVDALHALRSSVIPKTIGAVPGVDVAVTGETAGSADFTTTIAHRMPLVLGFVLLLTFTLMLLAFRSPVIALTAIALNTLSVAAAYGALTWVFQDGHLERQLHFHANGAIVPWVPLFLFSILFGLSMDYHVFVVSRIRELVDRGCPTAEAVERGIRSTAATVTSAALVMVAVFSIFATLDLLSMKEMGFGLAFAVLLDATIVRALLLPATMKLLGERNWATPRAFAWLPRLDLAAERP